MSLHRRRWRAFAVSCAVMTALLFSIRMAAAQDSLVQPSGYSATVMPSVAGPTWDDFNALAQRLQATEARLQAIGGTEDYTSYNTANIEYQNQNPYGVNPNPPPLATTTQTPPDSVLSRLSALEQTFAASQSKLPLVRMTGFAQLDEGFFGQDAGSRANLGNIQDGIGFRRARIQAVGNLSEFTRYSFEMDFATAGRPSFMDVWGEQTNVPFFGNLRIGHFRQPTTMDSWTSIRHLEFLERSLPFQAMDPFRRVGIMSWFNTGEYDQTLIAYSVYGTGLTFTNQGAALPSYSTLGDTRFATQIGDHGGVSAAIRASHLLYYDPYADNRYLLLLGDINAEGQK